MEHNENKNKSDFIKKYGAPMIACAAIAASTTIAATETAYADMALKPYENAESVNEIYGSSRKMTQQDDTLATAAVATGAVAAAVAGAGFVIRDKKKSSAEKPREEDTTTENLQDSKGNVPDNESPEHDSGHSNSATE